MNERPYTVISRKVVGKNVHATIPKGNMGYNQYTVPKDCSCRTYFGCFPLAIANITSQTSRAILSNFFEEQCTQNHPKYLSGLSRALFPTTFLEIAVFSKSGFNNLTFKIKITAHLEVILYELFLTFDDLRMCEASTPWWHQGQSPWIQTRFCWTSAWKETASFQNGQTEGILYLKWGVICLFSVSSKLF